MFDAVTVDKAMDILRNTPAEGKPVKILLCDHSPFGKLGVGAEWTGEIRNAVAFHGDAAQANYAETKRRVKEWIADASAR